MANSRIKQADWKRTLLLVAVIGLVACTDVTAPETGGADPSTIHFLIPGSPGSGYDASARATGAALTLAGLIEKASYENMPEGRGARAMAHLADTSAPQDGTLMVASMALLIQSLSSGTTTSIRDLTPVACLMGDYGALVVRVDSPFQSWAEVVAAYLADPGSVKVAGGSVRGGLDHMVASLAFEAAGSDIGAFRYVSYDGGSSALEGLLSGETAILSTGLSEILGPMRSGQVRILATTAADPLPEAPGIPTLTELGYDVQIVNWRGFFGAPDLPPERVDAYEKLLWELVQTDVWEGVRRRNGWWDLYQGSADFVGLLDWQSQKLADILEMQARFDADRKQTELRNRSLPGG